MDKQNDSLAEERTLGFVALFYSAVLLVGFVIGLYGFFSLLWMAGSRRAKYSYRRLVF